MPRPETRADSHSPRLLNAVQTRWMGGLRTLAFRAGTIPYMVPYYIPRCLDAFFGLYASHFVHYIQ